MTEEWSGQVFNSCSWHASSSWKKKKEKNAKCVVHMIVYSASLWEGFMGSSFPAKWKKPSQESL